MRRSKSLVPTLRDDPADAEALSHKLLLRAGFVRQLGAGIYVYLPLGQRVIDKVCAVIREEMNAIGGQEITMPVIHPAEIWKESGRWDAIGDEMFRLKDRAGRDLCLGMTHEEVVAWLAAHELRSYRDLPQIWYQLQTKERDEARPRSGILRTREFLMKDSYTLDRDEEGLAHAYDAHAAAYRRIFDRCGIVYHVVQSDPGMMGGLGSHEFMAPSAAGEDEIAICAACGYAANVELAQGRPAVPDFPTWTREDVATPGVRTIADVAAHLGVDPRLTVKSLVYVAPKAGVVLALVRGDHALHERKLARALGEDARPAQPDEVLKHLGAPVGSIGPLGAPVPVLADETLRTGSYVVGANRDGVHTKGVRIADADVRFVDLHTVAAGEACANCGATLAVERVIEIGNIFKLGTKYSKPLGAMYLDESGTSHPIVMGSYGIGPARIAAAAVEQGADADGIVWPWSIAPFHVNIVVVSTRDPAQVAAANEIYETCGRAGLEALLDDRDERPGVKFKDADLLGIPVRVTVGNALAKEGAVEVRARRTRQETRVAPRDVVEAVRAMRSGGA
jgi:prolyl-tRNA synthetase